MCIVIIKEAGKDLPSKETLEKCFDSNSDGAGIMFNRNNRVHIHKGFMKFDEFWKHHEAQGLNKDQAIIYHFRIATAGGVNQGNCHPFPISANPVELKTLSVNCKLGMAHNGILSVAEEKGLSDTMVFIRDTLSKCKSDLMQKRRSVINLIEMATSGSKLVFLYPNGSFIKTGRGWVEDDLLYSNTTYKAPKYIKFAGYPFDNRSWGKQWGQYKNPSLDHTGFEDTYEDAYEESEYYCENCYEQLIFMNGRYWCQGCGEEFSEMYLFNSQGCGDDTPMVCC